MESSSSLSAALLITLILIINSFPNSTSAARILIDQSDPTQQAQDAIATSLASARDVSAMVSALAKSGQLKADEAAVVKDCMVTVGDSVLELQRSLKQMKAAAGGERSTSPSVVVAKVEDVQTWVSAALADENTCMDGFQEKAIDDEVKRKIRDQIVKVSQLISKALALICEITKS